MAEILKQGAVISEEEDERARRWHRDYTCRRCKTVFRVRVGDVVLHDNGYGATLFDPYCWCPSCKTRHMMWFVPVWVRRLRYEGYGDKCNRCGRPQKDHAADNKCLFEPTVFSGVKVS